MNDIDRHLSELGVIARPAPRPPTASTRPPGDPKDWPGVWHKNNEIPH